jgi:lysophospholipase L1-like esterase
MPSLTRAIGAAAAVAALALSAAAAVPAAAADRPDSSPKPTYYLSLGDSLSVGDQPNAKGVTLPTNEGYADQLYNTIKRAHPGLRLWKVGCPGETSKTLNLGGICGYKGDARYSLTADKGVQLIAALNFLRSHRGEVPLITLDIGANDLNNCLTLTTIPAIVACLTPVFPAIQKNLAYTLAKLRNADPHAIIVGMTYYDPELADWLTGKAGQAFAQDSVAVAEVFDQDLTVVYQKYKVLVADVFTSFDTTDMSQLVNVPPFGKLPKDVAQICRWTWECAKPPVGPNEHANATGYGAIASTFEATLSKAGYKI